MGAAQRRELYFGGTPDECRERIASYEGVVAVVLLLNVTPAPDGDVVKSYEPLMQLAKGI